MSHPNPEKDFFGDNETEEVAEPVCEDCHGTGVVPQTTTVRDDSGHFITEETDYFKPCLCKDK